MSDDHRSLVGGRVGTAGAGLDGVVFPLRFLTGALRELWVLRGSVSDRFAGTPHGARQIDV
jgi:hypothetical protein